MKTKTLLTVSLIALSIFIVFSVIGGLKVMRLKKVTEEKAILETEYKALQKAKELADFEVEQKQIENKILTEEKTELELKLKQYEREKQVIIVDYEKKIAELVKIPVDTIYQYVYSYYTPLNSETANYPFTESQVRRIHLGIFEAQYLYKRLDATENSLIICKDLNDTNDRIIGNLSGQNTKLKEMNSISDKQINNLSNQLNICDKQNRKEKCKKFFYKATTVVTGALAFMFAIN